MKLDQSASTSFMAAEANTYSKYDSWLGCELGWNVDVHLEACRVRAKIRDLNQGAHYDGTEHRKHNEATVGKKSSYHFDEELKSRAVCVESGLRWGRGQARRPGRLL